MLVGPTEDHNFLLCFTLEELTHDLEGRFEFEVEVEVEVED